MEKKSAKDALIVLVSAIFTDTMIPGTSNRAPLGIMVLATILHNAGYRVKVINGASNADYEKNFYDMLKEETPLFIGFSVMTSQIKTSYKLTNEAKRLKPDVKIVWGGFHPTIYPNKTVCDKNIDVVVPGEAILNILPLAECLLNDGDMKDVQGVYYKNKDGIAHNPSTPFAEFNQIPDINWDILNYDELEKIITQQGSFQNNLRSLPLLTGLGCNFKCTFCHNSIRGVKYRTADAERIVSCIKSLKDRYKISGFEFTDENFFGDKQRFIEFLSILEKEELGIVFFGSMRASDLRDNYLTEPVLKRLYDAGGRYFGLGAESGSPRILKKLNKNITVEDIYNAARISLKTHIIFTFSFMVGIPNETIDEVYATLDTVRDIQKINPDLQIIGPQIFRVYPGSQLYEEAMALGLREPATLAEWTTVCFTSHFRKVEKASLPWIKDFSLFERIMAYYNIQSYNADISGLQSVLYWHALRKILPRHLHPKIFDFFQRLSERIVILIRWISYKRLTYRFMALALEYPVVSFLNNKYFKNS